MAGEEHGTKAILKLDDDASVLTVVDGFNSASLDEARETAEVTAFGDGTKRYIPALRDSTFSGEGNRTPTNRVLLRGAYEAEDPRDFEYFPAGDDAGEEKLAGQMLITSLNTQSSVDGAVTISVEFQLSGDVVSTDVP